MVAAAFVLLIGRAAALSKKMPVAHLSECLRRSHQNSGTTLTLRSLQRKAQD
jgi:hypothetical protein